MRVEAGIELGGRRDSRAGTAHAHHDTRGDGCTRWSRAGGGAARTTSIKESRLAMAIPDELSCQELIELVTEYVQGTLYQRNARASSGISTRTTGYRHYTSIGSGEAIQLVGALEGVDIPTDAKTHLLRVFRELEAGELAALYRDVSPVTSAGTTAAAAWPVQLRHRARRCAMAGGWDR